jgi:hypothetical protein
MRRGDRGMHRSCRAACAYRVRARLLSTVARTVLRGVPCTLFQALWMFVWVQLFRTASYMWVLCVCVSARMLDQGKAVNNLLKRQTPGFPGCNKAVCQCLGWVWPMGPAGSLDGLSRLRPLEVKPPGPEPRSRLLTLAVACLLLALRSSTTCAV